jgi:hypothetical protein
MSYLKILGARRKTKALPAMKKLHLSKQQKELARNGVCIKCEVTNAAKTSYLCDACQADDSIDDIRDQIDSLRRKLLYKQQA